MHQAVLAGVFVADAGLPPHRERKDPAVRDPRRVSCERQGSMSFEDIIYEASEGVATITINRPQVLNAFTGHTVDELTRAFLLAWYDRSVRAVILTGAGDRAFCAGGDQSKRSEEHTSELQSLMRISYAVFCLQNKNKEVM